MQNPLRILTVASVMSAFTKLILQLEKVIEQQEARKVKQKVKAEKQYHTYTETLESIDDCDAEIKDAHTAIANVKRVYSV